MKRMTSVILGLSILSNGCALTSTSRPPADYDGTSAPSCPADRGPVKTDLVIGGVSLGLAGVAAAGVALDTEGEVKTDATPGIIALAAIGAGFGVSALLGNGNVRACEEAFALYEEKRLANVAVLRKTPLESADLLIVNTYVDTLFDVSVHLPATDESFAVLEEGRVPTHGQLRLDEQLRGRPGQPVTLEVVSTVLGRQQRFSIDTEVQPGKTFLLHFDWDPALAEFRIQHGWQ